MGSLIPWIEVTIPGFVFLAATFIAFLCCAHIYDLESIKLDSIGTYMPYIAIGVVFLSYVVGLATHLVIHEAISILWPASKHGAADLITLQTLVPEQVRHSAGGTYGNLVMFRLMLFGFLSLELSLAFWLHKTVTPMPKRAIHITCWAFIVLFAITYFVQRGLYIGFQKEINTMYSPKTTLQTPVP